VAFQVADPGFKSRPEQYRPYRVFVSNKETIFVGNALICF
jgi:hypothetical protein